MGIRRNDFIVATMFAAITSSLAWTDSLPAQTATSDPFRRGLDEVHTVIADGKWAEGLEQLRALVDAHPRKPYVLARRTELVELARRCAFHARTSLDDLTDVASGDITVKKSGRIRFKYKKGEFRDFIKIAEGVLKHPVAFTGPFTVQLKGSRYPADYTQRTYVHLDAGPGIYYVVSIGVGPREGRAFSFFTKPVITRVVGKKRENLAIEEKNPVRGGRPYDVRVQVTSTHIDVRYGGKRLIKARRPRRDRIRHATICLPNVEEIIITGKGDPAWLHSRFDLAIETARDDFERTFDPAEYLPKWLSKTPAVALDSADRQRESWPEELDPRCRKADDKVFAWLDAGEKPKALTYLDSVGARLVPEDFRAWLRLRCTEDATDTDGLMAARVLARARPQFFVGRLELAKRFQAVEGPTAALTDASVSKLVEDFPDRLEAREYLAELQLSLGRRAVARKLIDGAFERSLTSRTLDRLNRTLVKGRLGPSRHTTYRRVTDHYVVSSDIDERFCDDAGEVLEQARKLFEEDLAPMPASAPDTKTEVHVFRGVKGYERYHRDIFSGWTAPHTAGLFVRSLGQVLVWSLPTRQASLEVLRHEAVHDYLFRIAPETPRWLHEGVAEYYEKIEVKGKNVRVGVVRQDHLVTLRRKPDEAGTIDVAPIEEIVFRSDRDFVDSDIKRHYAEAWALVHFLRQGGHDDVFTRLLQGLRFGRAKDVLRDVFTPTVIDKLEAGFLDHVDGLDDDKR